MTDEERFELDNVRMTLALQEKKIAHYQEQEANVKIINQKMREGLEELFRTKEEKQQLHNQNKSLQVKVDELQLFVS